MAVYNINYYSQYINPSDYTQFAVLLGPADISMASIAGFIELGCVIGTLQTAMSPFGFPDIPTAVAFFIDPANGFTQVIVDEIDAFFGTTGSTPGLVLNGLTEQEYNAIQAVVPTRTFASPVTITLNSASKISMTRDAFVSYPIEIGVSSLLLGSASCSLYLDYADNSGMSTNLVTFGPFTTAISGVLNVVNTGPVTVSGMIPKNKFRRVRSVTNSGTVTFTPRAGQEVLL